MKKVIIKQDDWWDSPGCDCCEPIQMTFFTSEDLSYTPSSEEACLVDLIEKYNPSLAEDPEELYLQDENFLLNELKKVGVEVEFIYLTEEDLV